MWRGRTLAAAISALLALVASVGALTAAAVAESPSPYDIGGTIAAGGHHSCVVLPFESLHCWGYGGDGALGYGNRLAIGDDEAPAAAGPVALAPSRPLEVAAGAVHTCVLLDDWRGVRCWGFGGDGRLGYGNVASIGDDETPASVPPVDVDFGHLPTAITAGGAHSCAVLAGNRVRCWGFGLDGRLGYGNTDSVGDDETPSSVGPVALGAGRTAGAISAGGAHTCAVLDDGTVRCWGEGANGQLGYGSIERVGDDETPAAAGPVNIGNRAAVAISAGGSHTCAVLDDYSVRCWGYGGNGRLGYGDRASVGDTETPASAGPVDLGAGRRARAITAGGAHTCALLDNGAVRCWGYGGSGALGYGNRMSIGDDETPGSVGPVDLGPGRSAVAIAAGGEHTCARLDDRTVRCWGAAAHGRLGHCQPTDVGDDETPAAVAPVNLGPPWAGVGGCPQTPPPVPPPDGAAPPPAPASGPIAAPPPARPDADPEAALAAAIASEAKRAKGLRDCRAAAARRQRSERRAVRARGRTRTGRGRVAALRRVDRRAAVRRRACLKRYGRVPGRVAKPAARAVGRTKIVLTFRAVGSDGARPPAARRYVIKQSPRPIRTARDFKRAPALCGGTCRFSATRVGVRITLDVTELRPRRTYYYAIAARDNVSGRIGPRSKTFRATTR